MPNRDGGQRILIFVSGLSSGGTERVAVRLSEWLRDAGHTVCLLTLSATSSDIYACPGGVERVGLGVLSARESLLGGIVANFERLRSVRKQVLLHQAEVVLSLGDRSNVLLLLATFGLRCRKLISERGDPERQPLPFPWNLLRRMSYPTASLHVSQSTYASAWIGKRFPSLACQVIGNAGELGGLPCGDLEKKRSGFQFAAIGRLSHEKGMDILLAAMALVRSWAVEPVRLVLGGDGVELESLRAQAARLGIDEVVTFAGRVADVRGLLCESDAVVIPSRWEGFPNAMIEAMTLGLPVVVARCRGGIEDVLETAGAPCALDFPPGDVQALARRMIEILVDARLREEMRLSALARAADFSAERVSAAWREAIQCK